MSDFNDHPETVAGFIVRPFTLGSKIACETMELPLFVGAQEGAKDMAVDFQVIAFLWMHHAPLKDVQAALQTGTWKQRVESFAFGIDFECMPEIVRWIKTISDRTAKVSFDVVQRPNSSDSDAPPN